MVGRAVAGVFDQLQAGFFRKPASLFDIATRAAGREVFPVRFTAARLGDDVVESNFMRFQRFAAILADIPITNQNIVLRSQLLAEGNVHEMHEPDHRGSWKGGPDRPEPEASRLFHDSQPLEDHDERAPDVADVNGLVRRIQDQHPRAQAACRCTDLRFCMNRLLVPTHTKKKPPAVAGGYLLIQNVLRSRKGFVLIER